MVIISNLLNSEGDSKEEEQKGEEKKEEEPKGKEDKGKEAENDNVELKGGIMRVVTCHFLSAFRCAITSWLGGSSMGL